MGIKKGFIYISPDFFLLLGILVFVLGAKMTAAVFIAAAFHEAGHFLAMKLSGLKAEKFCIGFFGMTIEYTGGLVSYQKEAASAAAGPAASFVLALLAALCDLRWFHMLSGISLTLGVFNLLPVSPLDGGRILFALLSVLWGPDRVALVRSFADKVICGIFLIGGITVFFYCGMNPTLLLMSAALVKVCCKTGTKGV